MKLSHVINEVVEKPWCILPSMHRTILGIVNDHVSGIAHAAGGCSDLFSEKEDDDEEIYTIESGVMTVNVDGVIARRVGSLSKMSGMCDVNDLVNAMERATLDDVQGVIIKFNSPGGGVNGLMAGHKAISELAKTKPVIAHVESLCASAAYWLASACTEIICEQTAHIGSIGVYMYLLDMSQNFAAQGIKAVAVTTGKYKGMGLPGTALTAEQIELLQSEVDQVFTWFKDAVRENRDVEDERMQGQTFLGEAAIECGLADMIGDENDAWTELELLIQRGMK